GPAGEVLVGGPELGLDLRVVGAVAGQDVSQLVEELLVLVDGGQPEGHLDGLAVVRVGLEFFQHGVERLGLARLPVLELHDPVRLGDGAVLEDALLPERDDRDHEDDEEQGRVVRLELGERAAVRAGHLDAVDAALAAIPGAAAVDDRGHMESRRGPRGLGYFAGTEASWKWEMALCAAPSHDSSNEAIAPHALACYPHLPLCRFTRKAGSPCTPASSTSPFFLRSSRLSAPPTTTSSAPIPSGSPASRRGT